MQKYNRSARGNVLFLILIAVALFAALSYAVTQSNKGGGGTISDDKLKLTVSRIVQYMDTMRHSVMRLQLAGYADHMLDFNNDVYGRYLTASPYTPSTPLTTANGTCSSNECKVFHLDGGGVSATDFGYDILPGGRDHTAWPIGNNWVYPGHISFQTIQVVDIGSTEPDLVAVMPYISLDVCKKLNTFFGLKGPYTHGTPVDSNDGAAGNYSGTLTSFPSSSQIHGNGAPEVAGKHAFCIKDNAGGTRYIFYYVLMER